MPARSIFFLFLVTAFSATAFGTHVEITTDRLQVDGKPAPFLFGAEVQYFRARGGSGRNVPAIEVEALWNKLLDRVQEAKMNAVTFYIPWDFHEPAEGVFDFDGTLDRDGDGKPDYPSRNIKKFIELVQARGIKYVMVRPGPYINAEWGPVGFGAIPKWFLEKYPQSLAVTNTAGKAQTASFQDPIYRQKVATWFHELYSHVLKSFIGPGKPIVFLQLDNETNYFWDSVYERDWSPGAVADYHRFLKDQYREIGSLNKAYGTSLADFPLVKGPRSADDKSYAGSAWHYDWFKFHDEAIRDYYRFLRTTWESLGVHEPDVLFTSCDSFNAPDNGLLPRLDYRQENRLSFTTMNIYPKTFGSAQQSTLNNPMKAAHDAQLVASAHRQFYGTAGDWVMSTETMGGWFPPTEVSLASRQHTYGSLIASGVKAMMIYYFHEGWNWNAEEKKDSELSFDAPLDKDMNPRPAFQLLKNLGNALEAGLGEAAVTSYTPSSAVLIAHDSSAQYPIPGGGDALKIASTDSASLFGLLRESGTRPEIAFIDRMTSRELSRYRVIFWDHPGYLSAATKTRFQDFLSQGGTLITIGNTGMSPASKGRLIVLEKNPALGWNEDSYLTLANTQKTKETLQQMKSLLLSAGVPPSLSVDTSDGLPFVHTWLRPTAKGFLIAVENFGLSPRQVFLKAPPPFNQASYRWRRAWSGQTRGVTQFDTEPGALGQTGVPLLLEGDGIELWEVELR